MNATQVAAVSLCMALPTVAWGGALLGLEAGHASGTMSSNEAILLNGSSAPKDINAVVTDSGLNLGLTMGYAFRITDGVELAPLLKAHSVFTGVAKPFKDSVAAQGFKIGNDSVYHITGMAGPAVFWQAQPWLRTSLFFGMGYGWSFYDFDLTKPGIVVSGDAESYSGFAWQVEGSVYYSALPWLHVGPSVGWFSQSFADNDKIVKGDLSWWTFSLGLLLAEAQ